MIKLRYLFLRSLPKTSRINLRQTTWHTSGILAPVRTSGLISFRSFSQEAQVKPSASPPQLEQPFQNHKFYEETDFIFHQEKENEFMYAKFHTWSEYKNTVFSPEMFPEEKWSSFPLIVQQLKELSSNSAEPIPIMDQSIASLRTSIAKEIGSLTDEGLFALLYALSFLPPSRRLSDPEYQEFWQKLDAECSKRMSTWGYDTMFVVDDLLHRAKIVRASNFHYQVIRKVFRKIDRLQKVHYMRFIYALNISRKAPTFMSNYDLECSLEKHMDSLNAEELCIVTLSLFKTETKIREQDLIRKIVDKVVCESTSLHSYLVSGVAKFLRHVSRLETAEIVYKFQDAFLPELPRLDPTACLQVALAATNAFIYHETLIEAAKQKIEQNLDRIRIKEIERMLLVLTMFNNNCKSFCETIVEHLRSEKSRNEIKKFGRCLPSILYYLSMQGLFPQDLINTALDTKFLLEHFGRNMAKYQRELLCLDFNVEHECPEYTGNRLDTKTKRKVSKYYLFYFNPWSEAKVTGYSANLKDLVEISTKILGGRDYVYVCNILPQYQTAELIFCLDQNKKPVEIPKSLRMIDEHNPKWIPKDDETPKNISYHALVLGNRNSCFNNSDKLLGQGVYHHKFLERMGYILHRIIPSEWQPCERSEEKERVVLMNRVFNQVLSQDYLKSLEHK